MGKKLTKIEVCTLVSDSLVTFGYSDCTPQMIGEVLDAWLDGKRYPDLPHGIIGAFAEEQFRDVSGRGADLTVYKGLPL